MKGINPLFIQLDMSASRSHSHTHALIPIVIMSSAPSTTTETALTAVHPDITRTHILTRLGGPALAALTCASTQLSALAADDDLWKSVTTATWPSTSDPRVRNAVSSFPSGHRSLFADSFPVLHHAPTTIAAASSAELISAVDLYYKDDPIFSTVQVTETESEWFRSSPFRVDILGQKESVPTRITNPDDEWRNHLEENLSLSWIVIDPARNKAANLSTRDPVSVQWINGDLQVRYSTVLGGSPAAAEIVQIGAVVNLGGGKWGGDQVHVTEVSMHVEDMEGRRLSGEDSVSILVAAMDGGRRKKWVRGGGKAKFEEYEERRRERKWMQNWKEKAVDLVCIAVGVPFLVTFWTYAIFSG